LCSDRVGKKVLKTRFINPCLSRHRVLSLREVQKEEEVYAFQLISYLNNKGFLCLFQALIRLNK
jgi:hypothetical protein